MKKEIKRIIALTLSVSILTAGDFSVITNAVCEIKSSHIKDNTINRLMEPSMDDVAYSIPEFKSIMDSDEKKSEPSAVYTFVNSKTALTEKEYPSNFDLRNIGKTTCVKNQGSNGTCWMFAASSSAEISMIDVLPSIDLSELHGAYFSYYGDDQIDIGDGTVEEWLDHGGNKDVIVNLWSQWKGPVNESVLPYDSIELLEDKSYAAGLENYADYHLKNAYMFDYEKDRSNYNEINDLVKYFVYNGKAVDVSFYSNNSTAYSKEEYASFCSEKPKKANHSVTIVGWDDDFSASAFKEYNGATPKNNGAWLVKNSWGTTLGNNGYMWISYEDSSLSEFAVFEIESKENYKTIYNHDTFVPVQTMSAWDDTEEKCASYMANIFTAEYDEQIEAVSTYINSSGMEYEIMIYSNLSDVSDPSSGKPSKVTRGVADFTGYQTFELDEDVVVKKGEQYSVVMKLYNDDTNFVIPLETCMVVKDYETGEIEELSTYTTYDQICRFTGKNESFYGENGNEWTDVTSENYVYTDEEKNELIVSIVKDLEDDGEPEEVIDAIEETYRRIFNSGDLYIVMGNISLKAFGNPVNTVDFSHFSGAVALNERVELSVKNNAEIYCTINGGDPFLYTKPLEIKEKTVISATSDGINYTERVYYPAKAEFSAIGYTDRKTGESVPLKYAERIDDEHFIINIGADTSEIRLYPVSGADVIMNGSEIKNYDYSNVIDLDLGSNVVTFELSGKNVENNKVMLTINRDVAVFDYKNETLAINGDYKLKTSDGTELSDGDSVGKYSGEVLKAIINNEVYEITVPERLELPELNIDYKDEILGKFDSKIVDYLEYSVSNTNKFKSAASRLIQIDKRNYAIRIIPGEVLDLRIASDGECFASNTAQYVIPEAETANDITPQYIETEKGLTFCPNNNIEYGYIEDIIEKTYIDELAIRYGYDIDKFNTLMMKRYNVKSIDELLKAMSVKWGVTEVEFGKDRMSEIAARVPAGKSEFSSASYFYIITGNKYKKGDVNGDESVNAIDASLVLMHYADISLEGEGLLNNTQKYAADYNNSGLIDAVDGTCILIHYAEQALK